MQRHLFPEDEPPTQHGLFDANAAAAATPPAPQRRLTREEIDRVRDVPGFPHADDEAIIALSDPPHYTACPNPFLAEIVAQWQQERSALRARLGLPADGQDPTAYQREPFAADVSEGKNDPIYNAHSYHTKVPHKAIMRYILHYTDPGDIVFDGFCGTGMTGVAAQLCGDRAAVEALGYIVDDAGYIYGGAEAPPTSPLVVGASAPSDGAKAPTTSPDGAKAPTTNPLPSLVVGASAPSPAPSPAPFSRLGARKALLNDLSPAATFIAYNYNTPVDAAAFEKEARRILREVEAECGWMYATTHSDGRQGRINYTVWSEVLSCPHCAHELVFLEEAMDANGQVQKEFFCSKCHAQLNKRMTQRLMENYYDHVNNMMARRVKRVPVLIEYVIQDQKFTKKPDANDLDIINQINQQANPYLFPAAALPFMFISHLKDHMSNFGITHLSHFFLARPSITLANAWQKCQAYAGDQRTKQFLIFIFDQAILGMSILNRYQPIQFGRMGGSQVNRFMSGVLYVPSQSSEVSLQYLLDNKIKRLHKVFNTIKTQHAQTAISLGSGTHIPGGDQTVDYIFTDPPFGENLQYSELNWFTEIFYKVLPDIRSEAVVNRAQQKDAQTYTNILAGCFQENYRLLKPGRWMTVEFHNSSNAIWNAIQEAITRAGFVIADVRTLDKQGETYKQSKQGLVKQDLVISAYKPRVGFEQQFAAIKGTEDGAWAFVREHLAAVPLFVAPRGKAEVIAERMPYLLFDRMVAFHLQRGATVPLSAAQFYAGLKQRFPERDGMYFLETQAPSYDHQRAAVGAVEQFTFYVSDEKSSIQWLRQLLTSDGPLSYQQIQPRFLQELQQNRSELLPELRDLLQANFIQDPQGRWLIPDPSNALHLEQLRQRELLREYASYQQGKGKLKSVRSEAVRTGFAAAYAQGDYRTILAVAARLPEAILREDPTILTYYDLAQMEDEGCS